MSNRARKDRKRAGIQFTKPQKRKTVFVPPWSLGITSGAEILAGLVIRGRL